MRHLTTLCLLGAAAALAQTSATLTIDTAHPKGHVSPTLYGLMTEEINYSYDGGLYAQLIRTPAFFAGWDEPAHWFAMPYGNAEATMELDKKVYRVPARPISLRFDVKRADGENLAGLGNEGYWGIPVKPSQSYELTLYAKGQDVGPMTASIISNDTGKVLASGKTEAVSNDWHEYHLTLTTGADVKASAANRFVLTFAHPGTVWFDYVSLFPPTYKNRANGNRVDLMERLAAMKPAFLRFPGGNYLEGDYIRERFQWKKTIGNPADRPTHRSPWNYQSSDGMGLLEFLDWCEDLNMQPVLAVYAGYSLKGEHVEPGSALQPYLDDALEEIEYVTGDTSTKWGAERAKDGHPQPFALRYVEIGNEDWFDKSGSYDGRFAQYFKAFKAKYPNLQLIATAPVKSVKPDLLDEHYYERADQMFAMADHYDNADRNGPKIFVGEWATREGTPTPELNAALGDAAWMTGLERNSDLIVMASYAPLFVNVNPGGMQWSTDLIGYDAQRTYGSPSYYAQVLFSNHIGTEILNGKLQSTEPRVFYSATRDEKSGTIYLKVVNGSTGQVDMHFNIEGSTSIQPHARTWTLTGNSRSETNLIDTPEQIVPHEGTIDNAGRSFTHQFAPLSITVVEIPTTSGS